MVFVNEIALHENIEPEKLYIYPSRVTPSKEKLQNIEMAQKNREEYWTRDELKSKSEWLNNMPTQFQEDMLNILVENLAIISRGMVDLREGVKNYE